MTVPTFRPIGSTAFDDDTPLHAEGGRRIVRDTLAVLNERPMQAANVFQRRTGDNTELQTLWRWCVNWGYIGPFTLYSPRPGTVRILLRLSTNGGAGAVRLYAVNGASQPRESDMDAATDAATVGEQQYYRLTTPSGNITLVTPVSPGVNTIWIAIRCEEDTDRSRETFSGPTVSALVSERVRPVLNLIVSDDDPIGMFAEVSDNSVTHSNGVFESFTIASLTGNLNVPVVFEPSLTKWVTNYVTPNAIGYVEVGWTTALYIDSVSVDGTDQLTLEDRAFGPAFRYLQLASAVFAGQAAQEAQRAHVHRLPVLAFGDGLIGSNATAAQNVVFQRLRRSALSSTSWQTISTIGLGVAAATPAVDWQEIVAGRTYRFDVYTSVLAVLTTPGTVDPTEIEYRARIVDESGAVLVTGEAVLAPLVVLNSADTPAGVQGFLSGASPGGTLYGCEAMSVRDDLVKFTPITLSVTPTGDLDIEPVQRLEIQVRAVDPALSAFLIATPPCVQMAST